LASCGEKAIQHVAHQQYRLGIDGGGTGCRARLTDLQGRVLGEGEGGPANLGLGVEVALESILQAARTALAQAGLNHTAMPSIDAGLGLAGANVPRQAEAFKRLSLPFRSVAVLSDAEVGCLGAHLGRDGGILILGTGSQGVLHRQGIFTTVGGWGFALSDAGSGAILGRAAVRRALLAHEGVQPASAFTQAVMDQVGGDPVAMVEWAAQARPREWAAHARATFGHAARGDPVALELVRASAQDVELMLDRLIALGATRISLMGGVAQPTRAYLSPRFASVLVPPLGDAMAGALLLCSPGAGGGPWRPPDAATSGHWH
jgi:glucosamine kinase